jgi:organic hydroperoxide reductase OsmC/OhrA
MIKYPLRFSSLAESQAGILTQWIAISGENQSALAIPPEFDGPGGALSPEDLFCQALTNCFIATFKVYAEMSKLEFEQVTATSDLTVDLDEHNKPVMKLLQIKVQIHKPSNAGKALMLAKKASSSGFILNSVKTECTFQYEVL